MSLLRKVCRYIFGLTIGLVIVGELILWLDDTAAKKHQYQTNPMGFVNAALDTYHNWTLEYPDTFTLPPGGTVDPNMIWNFAHDMGWRLSWLYPQANVMLDSEEWPLDAMYEVMLKGTLALIEGPIRERVWIMYDPKFVINTGIISRLSIVVISLHPSNRRHGLTSVQNWTVGGMKEWSLLQTPDETFVQKNRCVLEWLQHLKFGEADLETNLDFTQALHHKIPISPLQIKSPC